MPGPMEFSASATGGSPVEQLREALNGIFAQLRGAGGRAADFTAMTWRAAEPGAFDPSRSEIDLCYREVFGGFRPRITIESGDGLLDGAGVGRHRGARRPRLLWRQYNFAELERQMSPRSAAVSMQAVFEQKRRARRGVSRQASERRHRHRLWARPERDLRPVLSQAARRSSALGVHPRRLLAGERQARRARSRSPDAATPAMRSRRRTTISARRRRSGSSSSRCGAA